MDAVAKAALIFLGLLLAACAQLFAFLLAWGGEGWGTPLVYTMMLFVTYPVALVRLMDRDGTGVGVDVALLAAAVAATALLAWQTYAGAYVKYLNSWDPEAPVAALWLVFWSLAPALTAATITRRLMLRGTGERGRQRP